MNSQKVYIQKLYSDSTLPDKKTNGAAGYDVYAYCKDGDVEIEPGMIRLIPTGIAVEIPIGYHIEIRPRSGLSSKNGILIPNSPGTIDLDYRGEIFIPLLNISKQVFYVKHMMRVAQLLIRETIEIDWEIVEELGKTNRGNSGFGSTGSF